MKNLINYYYGLLINDFKKVNESYEFKINNKNYEFIPFYGDINKFYKNYLLLINNNKYCHEVVLNKDKDLLTLYDNKTYLLLKKNICIDQKVDINEIINYDIPVYGNYSLDWKKLWMNKIDYYEYQMSQVAVKYKILKSSFDYYIGLSETAIGILNYINLNDIKYYISHIRINQNEKLDQFFNPINIIIDSRVRDVAEYVKFKVFQEDIDIKEIIYYINKLNFNYSESLLLLSRLLYPSYFFDMYDKIIQEKISEEKINFYIKKNAVYGAFLRKIYQYIKNRYNSIEIEWLES